MDQLIIHNEMYLESNRLQFDLTLTDNLLLLSLVLLEK